MLLWHLKPPGSDQPWPAPKHPGFWTGVCASFVGLLNQFIAFCKCYIHAVKCKHMSMFLYQLQSVTSNIQAPLTCMFFFSNQVSGVHAWSSKNKKAGCHFNHPVHRPKCCGDAIGLELCQRKMELYIQSVRTVFAMPLKWRFIKDQIIFNAEILKQLFTKFDYWKEFLYGQAYPDCCPCVVFHPFYTSLPPDVFIYNVSCPLEHYLMFSHI